jgi:Uma2 family endonuclease
MTMSNSTQPVKPTGLLGPVSATAPPFSFDPHTVALFDQLKKRKLSPKEVALLNPENDALLTELKNLVLPSDDGVPLETNWHRLCMNLLIESVMVHMGARTDYFVGGNMCIYYSFELARNRDFRGPDFFFVDRTSLTPIRESWVVWNENDRYPDVIIELLSPSTAEVDRYDKFQIYEQRFCTADYFLYDPSTESLEGWHLVNGRYEPRSPNEHGRLWCSVLGLWVGIWRGQHLVYDTAWLRFFDNDGNVVPTSSELEHRVREEEQRRADKEQRRANKEQRRANKEQRRADKERRSKEEEQRRADAAEAEVARLRELLARQEKTDGPPAD